MATEGRTACVNAPSRKMFAPMFRARWQNIQNVINDSAFIKMIPEPYITYYMAYIRQCIQWSTGFVPMLHRGDFFSTGMGYTVCEIFVKECMTGGYRITSTNKKLKKLLEEWAKKTHLTNEFSQMFWHSNAGGNCLLALTPINNDLYLTAYPINRCFFEITRNGEVSRATFLNRFIAGEASYYTRETRIMYNGKPYYKVELAKGTLVVSPTWSSQSLKEVPLKIKASWEYSYGNIKPNTWYQLPLNSLGVYNVKNKAVAVAISDMPGYSDSTLYGALDVLYSIDFNYTQGQVDMYLGKGRGLIPKQYQPATINTGVTNVNVAEGRSFSEAIDEVALQDTFYTEIRTPTGESLKPTIMQPDLRGEAHKFIRDADLELLASKVGLSSSTLANHLTYNTSKTATEVNTEQDTTEKSVKTKRELANEALNAMLKEVALYYGYNESPEIEWGCAGSTSKEKEQALQEFNSGLMTIKQYLSTVYKDLNEEEIEKRANEIAEEQKAQEVKGFNDSNYFGDNDVFSKFKTE